MLAAVAVVGCTNTDDPPPFFDMDYQVRCKGDCNNAFDDKARTISHLDAEDGYSVSCNVSGAGSERVMNASFHCPGDSADCGGDYSFELANVFIGGNDPGAVCRVYVAEGANIYEGECTATDPSADKPCQVIIEEDGGDVSGTVMCVNIPNAVNQSQRRGVFSPGSESAAVFHIMNCTEL